MRRPLLQAALGLFILQMPLSCEDEISLLSSPERKGGKPLENLSEKPVIHNMPSVNDTTANKDNYTINFNNISITEYIRFVSKIANVNFVFNDEDLQFNVTIVSEDPVAPRNIMSILIQILRIHNLVVLEQENNLVITTARNVNQLATIVSSDLPEGKMGLVPIVTRVFRIRNANLATVAAVIRPMLSDSSLLELSAETKQLIVTDITTNVDKISSLLASLDTPHTSLEIDTYEARNADPADLISMASQIVAPFTEGNPFLLIPHPGTRSIFIVSTPYLIERALTVLEDLDISSKSADEMRTHHQIFLYKIQARSGDDLMAAIEEFGSQLRTKETSPKLAEALLDAKWVRESNSILFTADPETLDKIRELVPTFDASGGALAGMRSTFFIYKLQNASESQFSDSLTQLSDTLGKAPSPDRSLLEAIRNRKYLSDTDSFVFTGTENALVKLAEILPTFDIGRGGMGAGKGRQGFYLYQLTTSQGSAVITNLQKVASNLRESGLPNDALIKTIDNIKWIKENNSLLITGEPASIEQVKSLVAQFDGPGGTKMTGEGKSAFFIYKPVHKPLQAIKLALEDFGKDFQASGLIDPDLLQTLETIRSVEATQSLLITGSPASLEKTKELISKIDTTTLSEAQIQKLGEQTFLIYKIQYVPALQLINSLKGLSTELSATGAIDRSTVESVNTLKWIKETNSLLFTGSNESLQKVELMVKKFDIAALAPNHEGVPPSHFIVYTPKNVPGDELIKILDEFEQSLLSAGLADQSLYSTINNLKWVPSTSTLIISGEPGSIAKVEELIRRFDVPSKEIGADAPIASIENTSFLIYKLQYHQGNEILSALKQITGEIVKAGASSNQNLVNAINSLQWIKVTNSLLASGEPETLSKLKELIQNVDVPLKQVFIEVLVVETSLTNTQQFGLQWGGRMQYLNKFAAGTGNFPLQGANSTGVPVTTLTNQFQTGINAMNGSTGPVANNIPFASGFDLGVLGDIIMHKGRSFISLASLVNALETDTDSTILLNPKIIAQDGRTATIFIGSNLPFIGSLVQTQGGINQQQSSNIEYRDIGFNLTITPTIGNNNVVTLDITNDISEVIGGTSQGVSNQNQLTGISTTHTNVVTRVHVPDQHFVVLSGMIQDTKTRFRSAIPCLGGLPVIGLLFSENDRINSKHNLIIFMRPHVVSSASDFKAVTERQEDVFKDQAVLPVLKEEFDGGVDMVKRPEDE